MSFPVHGRIVRLLIVVVFIAGLSACSGGGSSTSMTSAPSSQHLYVLTGSRQILEFALPITSSSTPLLTVSVPGTAFLQVMAVDSNGNIALSDSAGKVTIFSGPLSNSSAPSAVFSSGFTFSGMVAFDSSGNLFVGGSTASGAGVNKFVPPFSSTSTPIPVVPVTTAFGAIGGPEATDGKGNLYFVQAGSTNGPCNVQVLSPPYTGAPSTIINGTCVDGPIAVAVSSTQLFLMIFHSVGGSVSVSNLSNNSSVGTLATPGAPNSVSADSNGNVYVAADGVSGNMVPMIWVFNAPLSGSNAPAVTLTMSGPTAPISGVIGK